jgi:hypothetical protein
MFFVPVQQALAQRAENVHRRPAECEEPIQNHLRLNQEQLEEVAEAFHGWREDNAGQPRRQHASLRRITNILSMVTFYTHAVLSRIFVFLVENKMAQTPTPKNTMELHRCYTSLMTVFKPSLVFRVAFNTDTNSTPTPNTFPTLKLDLTQDYQLRLNFGPFSDRSRCSCYLALDAVTYQASCPG